jgi:hypothetical protein
VSTLSEYESGEHDTQDTGSEQVKGSELRYKTHWIAKWLIIGHRYKTH